MAYSEGGPVVALLRHIGHQQEHAPISESTALRYLKEMNFSYKRYRYGFKKRNQKAVERARKVIRESGRLDREQRCELLYFDESDFSPIRRCNMAGVGSARRSVEPLAHRQRVNVLEALRHDGQLIWTTQQRPTTRDDVIAFLIR